MHKRAEVLKVPRNIRVFSESNLYHIVLKGINSQQLFFENNDYVLFLKEFKKACNTYNAKIVAFCLMSNHIHLLLKFEDSNDMPLLFKSFGASYVYKYNRQHNKTGKLFNGRYYSKPINDDSYFYTVIKYIHYNPVKAGICSGLEDYEWSSYNDYIYLKNGFTDVEYLKTILNDKEFEEIHIKSDKDLIDFFTINNSIHAIDDDSIIAYYNELKERFGKEETIRVLKQSGVSVNKMEKVLNIPRTMIKKHR